MELVAEPSELLECGRNGGDSTCSIQKWLARTSPLGASALHPLTGQRRTVTRSALQLSHKAPSRELRARHARRLQ